MLARLTVENSGEILLDGVRVQRSRQSQRLRRAYRRQVQMVFQDPFSSLNPAHDVGYHLRRPLRLHQGLRGKAAEAAALDLLAGCR